MALLAKLAGQPVHIVIIHERIQPQPPVNPAVLIKLAPDGMGDFKVIMIVVSGIKPLMQLIVGNTVQQPLSILYIAGIISVNVRFCCEVLP